MSHKKYTGRGGWHGGGRPKGTERPEGRKDIRRLGQRWTVEVGEMIDAYLNKHHLTQKQYLAIKVEEDMITPEIAEIATRLLEGCETVHNAENIELQNWTNDLTDEQLQSLWAYAERKNLKRYDEKENGVVSARFIAKAELEALAAV
jgi:hypothetical protein